jgi:GNAT superfamily N-acetyltransferase
VNEDYSSHYETPAVDDYLRLRRVAGLTPRSMAAAEKGLPNTVAGVVIRKDGRAVGMGRLIGDGLFYQVVDIAVEPEHQKKGLGKAIMACLMAELDKQATSEIYVSLIADGEAHRLYAQFGFAPTAPASIGMARWLRR